MLFMPGTLLDATYAKFSEGFEKAPAQFRVHVVFGDDASEGSVTDLLMSLGLRVVDGPSAQGAYTLSLPDGADGREVLSVLEGSSVVTLAEPVP